MLVSGYYHGQSGPSAVKRLQYDLWRQPANICIAMVQAPVIAMAWTAIATG
jgi:hypothetical protein